MMCRDNAIGGWKNCSSHVPVGRSRRILYSFEVFSLDQALNSFLDHGDVGHEARRELMDDFGNEIWVVKLFPLPRGVMNKHNGRGWYSSADCTYFIILTIAASILPLRERSFFFSVSFRSSTSSTLFPLDTTPIFIFWNWV